ncbi:MAG TPA: hypothetical protein PK095_09060, partial [Myxococcota bacterium]|nr:hypothetical protein [Myxococcota bacterium]
DELGFAEALAHWERAGRTFERLSLEAARSAGPIERAALERRWRAISERLRTRLSTISTPGATLGE